MEEVFRTLAIFTFCAVGAWAFPFKSRLHIDRRPTMRRER